MAEANAKLRISIKDGEFELSGSELFVTQQIDNFKELIVDSLKDQRFEITNPTITPVLGSETTLILQPGTSTQNTSGQPNAHSYPRVFHIDDDEIKIIKKAPGTNNAQKTVATALIYLWAKHSLGQYDVTYPEIRDLCKEQACLDESNFSAHLKSAKELMIVQGTGKFKQLKITLPGREKAEEIIKGLNG